MEKEQEAEGMMMMAGDGWMQGMKSLLAYEWVGWLGVGFCSHSLRAIGWRSDLPLLCYDRIQPLRDSAAH